ncbi:RES family NAD+ phosphorylase [Belliella sp. DSM 107340]|uniref:RES family NAD+ phosphorylase n=1 Tax=Belliella calami TaxID=2923436 RepID=A0ABS9UP62_9BACT|nr:RES family NAD+ phosphorylase [Belliella calami]MCH7398417.1 RES family NAD+ phosphorylase [Belliella calami]
MILYRISREAYAKDLSGIGAMLYGGRWNSKGRAALYTAGSVSLAMLEVAVHITPNHAPKDFQLVKIQVPDFQIKKIKVEDLHNSWRESPPSQFTQDIGDEFLDKQNHFILQVPSVIVPDEFNYIINPTHPQSSNIQIISIEPIRFDPRLFP